MSEKSRQKQNHSELTIFKPVDKEKVKAQILEIRGLRVMLDKDIAEYFGVTTGNLNKAMKRNIQRFPESFCFQLTTNELLRFQFGISKQSSKTQGGRRYLPFVYSESGVAMLTSVLHTEKAVEASILIIEAFVEMSHYLRQNVQLLPYQEIQRLESMQLKTEAKVNRFEEKMITREDLSDLMKLFDQGITNEEILILDGQPFKADIAYQQIYRKAKKKITVIDDYISVKTLQHLAVAKDSTTITTITRIMGIDEYRNVLASMLTNPALVLK